MPCRRSIVFDRLISSHQLFLRSPAVTPAKISKGGTTRSLPLTKNFQDFCLEITSGEVTWPCRPSIPDQKFPKNSPEMASRRGHRPWGENPPDHLWHVIPPSCKLMAMTNNVPSTRPQISQPPTPTTLSVAVTIHPTIHGLSRYLSPVIDVAVLSSITHPSDRSRPVIIISATSSVAVTIHPIIYLSMHCLSSCKLTAVLSSVTHPSDRSRPVIIISATSSVAVTIHPIIHLSMHCLSSCKLMAVLSSITHPSDHNRPVVITGSTKKTG